MANLIEPEATDYEWLSDEARLSPSAIPSVAKVRLDNWLFSPNYTSAYAAAWQTLLARARELALPILHLQRHSLELVTKDILQFLLEIRTELRLAHEIFATPARACIIDRADWDTDWKTAHFGHNYGPLFATLDKNLRMLDLPPLPEEFVKAKILFDELEQNDASRWRYRTVRGTAKTKRVESFEGSLDTPIIADLGESTRLLTRIVSEHAHFDDEAESSSFLQEIVDMGRVVNYDIRERLNALETATRNDNVIWEQTRVPPVDVAAFGVEKRARLDPNYMRATYDGRRFVIAVIRDGVVAESTNGRTRQHAFYLASQRADGSFSEVLLPRAYESNLVSAALDALRRHYPKVLADRP